MKIWLAALCSLLFVGVSAHAGERHTKGKVVYTTLKSVAYFATGGAGRAGVTSQGEKALRVLLKQKRPTVALYSLLKEKNPAAQRYALVGLKKLNAAGFEKAVAPFLDDETQVETLYGCIGDCETVAKVADDIRNGNHPLRPEREPK